jgi:small subunit ribosomal protein S6e
MLTFVCAGKRAHFKAPKIQRLITPAVLQRKRHRAALKRRRVDKRRAGAAEYHKLVAQLKKVHTHFKLNKCFILQEKAEEKAARRRSTRTKSQSDVSRSSVSSK